MQPGQLAALAAIRAAFVDPEPLTYVQAGGALPPISAVRLDEAAPEFPGAGASLRRITYEIEQADLFDLPTKKDHILHRGRLWRVQDATRRDDIGAWHVMVTDEGAA